MSFRVHDYLRGMTALVGRRVGGFYLLSNHPWLVVAILVVVVAVVIYLRRRS